MSFRADDEDIAEVDAATYEAVPFTADELALDPADAWGPVEDWSDWAS